MRRDPIQFRESQAGIAPGDDVVAHSAFVIREAVTEMQATPAETGIHGGLPQPRRFWAMFAITIAIILAVLDTVIATVALPTIARDLAVQPATAIWVVIAYQLAVGASLFPLAALGDRVGYEAIYSGGLLLFTVASLACAMSPSIPILVTARLFQGLGASGIMCVHMAIVRFIFPRHSMGRGISYGTLIVSLSATVGPTIASFILSVASWPWLFLVNVPLGVIAFAIAIFALPNTPRSRRELDIGGAILSALALGLLTLAIDRFGRSDWWPVAVIEFGTSVLVVAWLLRHQLAKPTPVLPLDLLRIPIVRFSALTSLCAYVVQGISFIALPFYLHDMQHFSLTEVGWAITPWPLAVAVSSNIAGRLSDRYSAGTIGTVGLAGLVLGLAALAFAPSDLHAFGVSWRMALCGFAFGLFVVPNSRAIMSHVPMHRSGGGAAVQSAGRIFGQSFGAALAAAVFGLFPERGSEASLFVGLGFSVLACFASSLRLR